MTRVRSRSWLGPKTVYIHDGVTHATLQLSGGNERIEDLTHDLSNLGQGDCGGPMLLTRDNYVYKTYENKSGRQKGSTYYVRSHVPTGRPSLLTDAAIKGSGTTAIARTIPTNPIHQGATLLAETVTGGLPAMAGMNLWKQRTQASRAAGSEYLNYQFGWLPLVSDIRSFAYAVKNSHQILKDFHEGSGKNTRVGYKFPETRFQQVTPGNVQSIRADNVGWDVGWGHTSENSGSRIWFNGCFTYYVPVAKDTMSSIGRFAADANKLLGVRLTPEVLWNAAPWSWGLDWFGNMGDVIHNASALSSDGLVLKYGYVMYHNYSETWRVMPTTGASTQRVTETKKRLPASPYSLFAEPTALTGRQTAILAALGLSKR